MNCLLDREAYDGSAVGKVPGKANYAVRLVAQARADASKQRQPRLLFLSRHVSERELGDRGKVIRARKLRRLPAVMPPAFGMKMATGLPAGTGLEKYGHRRAGRAS